MFGDKSVEPIKVVVKELIDILVCDECYDESDKDTLREEATKRFFTQFPNGNREIFKICLAKELHEESIEEIQIEEPKEEPKEEQEERLSNEEVYELISEMLYSLSSKMPEKDLIKEVRRRMLEQYKNIDKSLIPACCAIWFEKKEEEKNTSSCELRMECRDDEEKQSNEKQEKCSENQIIYDTIIAKKKGDRLKSISFEEVDKYDFRKGFNEFIENQPFVHLYFDFDSIKSEEELIDVFNWLDSLKNTFGDYSVGGYSDSELICKKYGFKYIQDGGHYLSMHIVFYTTRISSTELVQIMKHTTKKGFATKGIHPLCDPAPYKLDKRQVFRLVLSDKIFDSNNENNKRNAGTILNNLPPSTQIIQVRGTESIITKDLWRKHFELNKKDVFRSVIKINKEIIANDSKSSKSNNSSYSTIMPEDWIGVNESTVHIPSSESNDCLSGLNNLECVEKLIVLNEEQLTALLNEFPPEFSYFEDVMANLLHSPYEKDFVESILLTWYNKRQHHNGFPQAYLDSYYEKTETNKWFNSIINHLPKNKKISWLNEIRYQSVDESVVINLNEDFGLKEIRKQDYTIKGKAVGININKVQTDLKRIIAWVDGKGLNYIVKGHEHEKQDKKKYFVNFMKKDEFRELLQSIYIGEYYKDGRMKQATAWTIFNEKKNSEYFRKDGIKFYSTNPDIFSIFRVFDYQEVKEVDLAKIELYLNHIKEVIASGDDAMYEYILNWIAFVLQNPGQKSKVALIFTGKEGAGKNAFTDVLCDLMKHYSSKNVSNIDSIVGKFNSTLVNKILIIYNELSSADSNKSLNVDILKALLTEDEGLTHKKFEDEKKREECINYIFLSNHFEPIRISQNDRRYFINEVSDKYCGNNEYFNKLFAYFDKEFYENLLTFFRRHDITNFQPHEIMMTESKKEIMELSKSSYQLFYERFYERFVVGWNADCCYNRFKLFVEDNNFAICSSTTFGKNMKQFENHKRIREDGTRKYFYFAKVKIEDNADELEDNVDNNNFGCTD